MAQQQRLVSEDFQTRKPASPLYCHQDFLEKLQDNPAGKRAALLLQRLAVDPRRQHYKATMGLKIADGSVSQIQLHTTGTISFNGNDRDVDRTTTTEFKDIGSTKVEVPDDAKKKLE